MVVFFNVIVHILMIGAMVAFGITLYVMLLASERPVERLVRTLALFAGAMVVLGAQSSGMSYADFIVRSAQETNTSGLGLWGTVAPGLAGLGVGRYFAIAFRKGDDDLSMRLLLFIGTLSLTQFASVYAVAIQNEGVDLGKAAVPNLSFCVALFLYVIFKMPTGKARRRGTVEEAGLSRRLLQILEKRRTGGPDPLQPDAPTRSPLPAQTRLK